MEVSRYHLKSGDIWRLSVCHPLTETALDASKPKQRGFWPLRRAVTNYSRKKTRFLAAQDSTTKKELRKLDVIF